MKELEGIARELFTKFHLKETGKHGDWDYLSDERKLAWMQDVCWIASSIIKEIKTEFRPLPISTKTNTVYESGYMEGVRSERIYNQNVVSEIEENLIDQLDNSKYNK